jgi:hypothetical protein
MPTLAIVGAGPKGIAIAAKARAVEAAGLAAPRVVLIDRSDVAGNWSGRQGFTSGLLPLGTPPEKDVGFPLQPGLGRGVICRHHGDGSLQLAAALGRSRLVRRLGRSRPPPAHTPVVGQREIATLGQRASKRVEVHLRISAPAHVAARATARVGGPNLRWTCDENGGENDDRPQDRNT